MSTDLSLAFALLLAAHLVLRLWLSVRQMRHVARHANVVPAEFAEAIPLADHHKAALYTIAKQRLGMQETLVGATLFVALTWGGGLQWLALQAAALAGNGLGAQLLLLAMVFGLLGLIELPIDYWRQFGLEARFGFNRMSPALFFADALKSLLVGIVLGLPLVLLVLSLMRHAGTYWWVLAWLGWAAFSLTLSVAYPALIAPLFNRFTPLGEGPLRERIGALLTRTGFRSSGVYTMDGSRRSSHGNAYFTGMGTAKRIVFFDTLVARLQLDEIEAVLAHELGHFRLHHIRARIVGSLLLALGWLAVLGWLCTQDWFAASLGVHAAPGMPEQALALVLFALVMPLFTFLFAPLQSAYSRRHEFQADAFAAQHSSAASLVRALVKLYHDNAATLTPDPLHSAFHDSHPPASIRIARLRGLAGSANA